MAEKLDPREIVTFEELLLSNTLEQEALVNLLEKKGLISKQELLEEIKKLRNQQGNRIIDGQTGERELIEDLEQDDDDF